MGYGIKRVSIFLCLIVFAHCLNADPFPPTWNGGAGASIHYAPVNWPSEPVNPVDCGATCGDWKAYTRFQQSMNDPRTNDPSNGGTSPQAYVNVASSCTDKTKPSIYYSLYQGATEADDVLMFRWRVESAAHNYATGPSAGSYGASNPWSSALWTVLFDLDGSGYRSLAAHLDGSTGSPAKPIDMLVGIWGDTASHSLDYINDPKVHLLGHNPTAFIGATGKILNFQSALNPTETWANGSAETVWDYGTTRARRVTQNSCTEYFIDYQIPIALLDASGINGPKITRNTPISMLFCSANSLNNPFQKDCAVNKAWGADAAAAAPFGDYLSFNQTEPYSQPIIADVEAVAPNSCPGTYALKATVQDTLALQSGAVVPSVQSVDFYYWFDADGDGEADDAGSEWTKITPAASLDTGSLNKWSSNWDASSLPKGKYLIGAQALDDNTKLDDGMTATGINNRTFSYLSGNAANKIYVNNTWIAGQQVLFPDHSPNQSPSASENWYGNPDVTGQQLALVGTAINACGVAPTIALSADVSNVVAGDTVNYTITLTNPNNNNGAVTFSEVNFALPTGFTYQTSTTVGTGGLGSADPASSGQTLTWSYGSPVSLAVGASITLSFDATSTTTAGNYNATAGAVSSFGVLTSDPVAVAVDAARIGLTATPDAYSVPADDTTNITFTYSYTNDSTIDLTNAAVTGTLPAGSTYVSCSGGTGCSNTAGSLSWPIGNLAGGATGSVTLTLKVPASWSTSSLTASATLQANAPDASTVTKTASASVAVTGYVVPGVAAMTLTKSASAVRIAPSGSVTYTLSYSNTGTADAANVVLTDTLPNGMTYSSSTGSGVHSLGVVTWSLGTVAQGASGSVTVTATAAASPFTYANPTTNTASINWTGGSAVAAQAQVGISGDYCSAVFYFRQGADNNLATVRPASQTSPAGSSAYTTTLSGISDNTFDTYLAEVNQVVFEQAAVLGSSLDISGTTLTIDYFLSAAQGGGRSRVILRNDTQNTTIATSSELNISTGTGSWYSFTATVPASTTIGANDKLRWYFQFRASGGKDITFHYDSATVNSRSSFCTTTGPAVLSLSGSVSQTSIVEATTPTLTYTLNYANTGGTTATNVLLVGNLPSGFTGCEYSSNGSSWSSCSSGSSHTFATIASLAAGAGSTVYVRGAVPSGTQAGDTLTAAPSVDSDQTALSSISIETDVIAAGGGGGTPNIALLLSADTSSAVPGDQVVYTLKAVNIGDASATNVVITNPLPVQSYFTYDSCTGGCNNASDTLTWNAGTFTAGQTKTYTYTMTVGSTGLLAGVFSINDFLSAAGDAALTATSNTVTVNISGNPSLSASMTATPNIGLVPGDTITYSATVTNTGNALASDVMVSDPIPTYTQYAGNLTSSVGTASFDAVNNRVLLDVGNLAAGASVTYSFKVTVSSLNSGSTLITNTATASASNAAQKTFSATASASAAAELELSQTLAGSGAYPSASLTANANGTTIFVDRTDRFHVNQYIKVGSDVRQIIGLGAKTLNLNASLTATSGDPVIGALTLTLAYRNIGNATATSVTLTDTLPSGLGFYSAASTTSAPAVGASGVVTWTIGSLVPNASGTRTMLVFPTGTTGTLTVEGLVEASNATDVTADVDVVVGGISVTKSTSTPLLSAGGTATYTITLSNSLNSVVNNIDVTDWLPAGFSYVVSSATVGGVPTEPSFNGADTNQQQPTWTGLSVPAHSSVDIVLQVNIAASAGAATYQNEVSVTVPAGVGLSAFDPIRTYAEDVTVLAANTGALKGYVFFRDTGVGSSYDVLTDTPLTGVRVEIYKAGADCNDPYSATCYVTYTDASGYFEQILAAEGWYVKVVTSGDLDASWTQTVGNNAAEITVVNQNSVWNYKGFSLVSSSSSSSAVSSSAVSSSAASSSVGLSSEASSSAIASSSTASSVAVVNSSDASSSAASSIATSSSVASSSLVAVSSMASSEASSFAASSSAVSSSMVTSSEASSSAITSSESSSVALSSSEAASSVGASSEASSSETSSNASSFAVSSSQSSSSVASSSSPLLALVDANNNAYSGETLARDQHKAFRVLGGRGAISVAASVLRGGNLSLFGAGTVEDFFDANGATLTGNINAGYNFSAKRSGVYSLSFTDEDGQEVSVVFTVHPRVAFTSTYQLGTQGVALMVSVILDDDPVDYPVVVPFNVEGSDLAEDLAASGFYSLTEGHEVHLNLVPIANAGSIRLTLVETGLQNATLGGLIGHHIELVSPAAVPLNLTLSSIQADEPKTLVLRDGGLVSLLTSLTGDGYRYDWSGSDPALGIAAADGSLALVDPTNLDGRYLVRVRVTELASPNRSLVAELYLRVVPSVPAAYTEFLTGQTEYEAYQLPICLDGGMNRVVACSDELEAIFMETLDTYTLKLGRTSDYASWREEEFALSVEMTDILDEKGNPAVNQVDREYNHLGYRVDFELSGLEQAGQSVPVVVPLKPGLLIDQNAVWRKYQDGVGWRNFVEDERNSLASAARGADGLCPWPAAEDWRAGLNVGDDCVRLIIEDGGPNDADARADNVIRDPSTLATRSASHDVTTVGKGSGAMSWYELLLLALCGLFFLRSETRFSLARTPRALGKGAHYRHTKSEFK